MLRLKICSLRSLLFFILLKGVGQPNQTKQNKTDFLFRDPHWDKTKLSNQEGKKGKKNTHSDKLVALLKTAYRLFLTSQ